MNSLLTFSPLIIPPILGYYLAKHLAMRGNTKTKTGIYSIAATIFSFLILVIFAVPDKTDETAIKSNQVASQTKTPNPQQLTPNNIKQQENPNKKKYQGKLFELIGKPIAKANNVLGHDKNNTSNIIFDDGNLSFLYETYQEKISYVEIDFKDTAPCNQNSGFDSIALLERIGISANKLELARKSSHFHTYYDHKNKLKVGISCSYNGAPISIGFSKRYYMQ
ncbi:MAG: hypothetical protein ACRC02_04785 [Vogesella sp.]|uniref:hypothetical protein n=1 Tax=Vogesella sp. TaxID=1904252 RepID=UPI003F418C9E